MGQVATIEVSSLPGLVSSASHRLALATSAAEVLEARDAASYAYDQAKAAARFAKAKGAHDELIATVHRTQADALEIEAQAKRRLADEYDAAQDRGEVATRDRGGANLPNGVSGGNTVATVADLGLTRKQVHEARQIRDAEKADPGIVRRVLDQRLAERQEPTKAAVREAVDNVVAIDKLRSPRKPAAVIDEEVDREAAAEEAAEEERTADEVDLTTLEGRAHAFNGALSTLDLIDIRGREYWKVFGEAPARETYESWVRSAHGKLTDIIREMDNGIHGREQDQARRHGKGSRRDGSRRDS